MMWLEIYKKLRLCLLGKMMHTIADTNVTAKFIQSTFLIDTGAS